MCAACDLGAVPVHVHQRTQRVQKHHGSGEIDPGQLYQSSLQLASHPQRAKVSALRSGMRTLDQDALEAYEAAEGRAQVLREGWEGVGKPVMAAGRAQAAREVLRKKHAGPEPSEVVTSRGASDHKEIGMTALEAPNWLGSAMPLAPRSTTSTPTKPRDRLPTKNPAARRRN